MTQPPLVRSNSADSIRHVSLTPSSAPSTNVPHFATEDFQSNKGAVTGQVKVGNRSSDSDLKFLVANLNKSAANVKEPAANKISPALKEAISLYLTLNSDETETTRGTPLENYLSKIEEFFETRKAEREKELKKKLETEVERALDKEIKLKIDNKLKNGSKIDPKTLKVNFQNDENFKNNLTKNLQERFKKNFQNVNEHINNSTILPFINKSKECLKQLTELKASTRSNDWLKDLKKFELSKECFQEFNSNVDHFVKSVDEFLEIFKRSKNDELNKNLLRRLETKLDDFTMVLQSAVYSKLIGECSKKFFKDFNEAATPLPRPDKDKMEAHKKTNAMEYMKFHPCIPKYIEVPGYATGDMFGIAAFLLENPLAHALLIKSESNSLVDNSKKIHSFFLESGILPEQIIFLKAKDLPNYDNQIVRNAIKERINKMYLESHVTKTMITPGPVSTEKPPLAIEGHPELKQLISRNKIDNFFYKPVSVGTEFIANNFSEEIRINLRKAWNVESKYHGKDVQINNWLMEKGVKISEDDNPMILWSRFSGKKGDVHIEHDTSFEGIRQLVKMASDAGFKPILIVGDKHPRLKNKFTTIAEGANDNYNGGSGLVYDLTEYWDDKDNKSLESWGGYNRSGQLKLYDFIHRKSNNSSVHLGFRSGSLEALALIGMKVRYLEDDGSESGPRMEAWHEVNEGKTEKGALAPGYERIVVNRVPSASGQYRSQEVAGLTHAKAAINTWFKTNERFELSKSCDLEVLWSRFSGKKGERNTEHTTDYDEMVRLAKEATENGYKTIQIVNINYLKPESEKILTVMDVDLSTYNETEEDNLISNDYYSNTTNIPSDVNAFEFLIGIPIEDLKNKIGDIDGPLPADKNNDSQPKAKSVGLTDKTNSQNPVQGSSTGDIARPLPTDENHNSKSKVRTMASKDKKNSDNRAQQRSPNLVGRLPDLSSSALMEWAPAHRIEKLRDDQSSLKPKGNVFSKEIGLNSRGFLPDDLKKIINEMIALRESKRVKESSSSSLNES